ncbi:MAG: efflux RND transporter periplasmic adaptor subunit [Cephaloticoccus sp.]
MNAFPSSPRADRPAPLRRWTRALPWLGGAALIALIVIGLWPKPLPAEIATVAPGPLQVTVNEEGMTRLQHRYTVSSPVAGLLRRIDLKPGTAVETGQTVIAMLDTRGADLLDARTRAQAEAQVQAATATLEQVAAQQVAAIATATLARTEFERIQKLYTSGSASRQEFDAAELRTTRADQEARAAEFAHQVAQHQLTQARAVLARGVENNGNDAPFVITSPVSGRLLKVFQESERVVPAGFPLVEVGDPTDLEARIEVLSRDAVAIAPGAAVTLHKWGGAEPLRGRVRVVEPAAFTKISSLGVEEQRVYVIVDLLDPPAARAALGDSYRVEAAIVTWSAPAVLKAPAGAFFQRGQQWQTYVLDGRRARLREVEVGHGNGLETEVISGLSAGDRVVVYPGDRMADGVRVAPMTVVAP